jgi:hypothetical protein
MTNRDIFLHISTIAGLRRGLISGNDSFRPLNQVGFKTEASVANRAGGRLY